MKYRLQTLSAALLFLCGCSRNEYLVTIEIQGDGKDEWKTTMVNIQAPKFGQEQMDWSFRYCKTNWPGQGDKVVIMNVQRLE